MNPLKIVKAGLAAIGVFLIFAGYGHAANSEPSPGSAYGSEDAEPDGLVNDEESKIGTLPKNPDTDGDGVNDGEDGWAGGVSPGEESKAAPPRLPDPHYALIDIAKEDDQKNNPLVDPPLLSDAGEVVYGFKQTDALWTGGADPIWTKSYPVYKFYTFKTGTPVAFQTPAPPNPDTVDAAATFIPKAINKVGSLAGYSFSFTTEDANTTTRDKLVPAVRLGTTVGTNKSFSLLNNPIPQENVGIDLYGWGTAISDDGVIVGTCNGGSATGWQRAGVKWATAQSSGQVIEGTIKQHIAGENEEDPHPEEGHTFFPWAIAPDDSGTMVGYYEDADDYSNSQNRLYTGATHIADLEGSILTKGQNLTSGFKIYLKSLSYSPAVNIIAPANTSVSVTDLNGRMQGVLSKSIGNSAPSPGLWQNYASYSLEDILGDALTKPDGKKRWSDFSLSSINEEGLIVGIATKDENNDGQFDLGDYPDWDGPDKRHVVLLVPCDLAVDANRDGIIKFLGNFSDANSIGQPQDTTSQDNPFRFWCNDDNDRLPEYSDPDTPEGEAISSTGTFPKDVQDCARNQIEFKRDLEDFTRLYINIDGLQDAIANGTIQVGLEWRDVTGSGAPSIKIYQAAEPDGGEEYIRGGGTQGNENENWANAQILAPFNTALGTVDHTGGFKFPVAFWQSNSYGLTTFNTDHSNRYILFEGVTEGKGRLVLTFWKGTTLIGEGGGVWLDLKNVRKMYRRGKVTQAAPDIVDPWNNDAPPPLAWVWDLGDGVSEMDPKAEKKTICFVHGWRMPYMEYLSWSDTTFKRLWLAGYKGSFYSFRWPTYSGETGGHSPIDAFSPGGSTYNPSEYRAWLSGPVLASFVNGLPNSSNRYLIAHSMGNVIAGSALRSGMQVSIYAMCNAAMSAMAYDSTKVDFNYATPDTDTEQTVREKFGLADKFNLGSTTIISFALAADNATLSLWGLNNELFKPQAFASLDEYMYAPYQTPPAHRLYYNPLLGSQRDITSVPEAMGYVTQSRSRAAGTKLQGEIGGAVSQVVDMGAKYHFGTEHSAEWGRSIQPTYLFWKEVLKQFQIDTGKH